jgi:hypothetical protein
MSRSIPQVINGFPRIDWHRAIFRFPPTPIPAVAVGAGIGTSLGAGHPVKNADWDRYAIELGAAGFTPATFTLLRESTRDRAAQIAAARPDLVTETVGEGRPFHRAFRFTPAAWSEWLELVGSGVAASDSVDRIVG